MVVVADCEYVAYRCLQALQSEESVLDENEAVTGLASFPSSLSAFCSGALSQCCVDEPELLGCLLYLNSVFQRQSLSHGCSSACFKLVATFFNAFPWRIGPREQDGGLEPVADPIAVERWFLGA